VGIDLVLSKKHTDVASKKTEANRALGSRRDEAEVAWTVAMLLSSSGLTRFDSFTVMAICINKEDVECTMGYIVVTRSPFCSLHYFIFQLDKPREQPDHVDAGQDSCDKHPTASSPPPSNRLLSVS